MTLYSLHHIKKIYNSRVVLDIAELEIDRGVIYSLSGPNGAGKTTLLNILGFLLTPSSGHFLYKNSPVPKAENTLQKLRRSVVMVDQHPILFSTSVYKNIEFGLKTRKIPRKDRHRIIESSIERVGMEDFVYEDARYLSGGETRRIALARALACSPEVLLLDEPTADLDLENKITIEQIIHDISLSDKISIILCTHNMSLANRLNSRQINLFNGCLTGLRHENIFKGKVVKENKRYFCQISENLRIPIHPVAEETIKIAINPNSVFISGQQVNNKNLGAFDGRIIQLSEEKENIRVRIDIGVPISMMITKSEYHPRHFSIGNNIRICLDAEGIEII